MGIFDKVKNLFTEEVEDEPIIKKEVRHIEVPAPTRVERERRSDDIDFSEETSKEEKKEEKFVFFSDEDFKDLEKPKVEEKKVVQKKEEKPLYRGATINPIVDEPKKSFKPSPIISPVYGVLDKNYSKEEVISKKVIPTRTYRSDTKVSVDDIRNKAFGTIEDELKDSLLGKTEIFADDDDLDIDIFEELEKYEDLDKLEEQNNVQSDNIDDLFEELDSKKVEILDELDNKKVEILDELDNKKEDILIEEPELDEVDLDDEALELSRQLESQKRQLDELNDFIEDDNVESVDNPDNLDESELFDLIDSMYEKRDEE